MNIGLILALLLFNVINQNSFFVNSQYQYSNTTKGN